MLRTGRLIGIVTLVLASLSVGVAAHAASVPSIVARAAGPAFATATSSTGPTGGYTLDGFGGVHSFRIGSDPLPPATSGGGYWIGWDIARGLAILSDGSGGYVLDGYGGLHPLTVGAGAVPPALIGVAYWRGWDIARGVALLPNGRGGYVVDAYGGIHPFATRTNSAPPSTVGAPYWVGQDMARGIAIMPDGTGGYVVDRTGQLHPFEIGTSSVAPPAATNVFGAGAVSVQGVSVSFDGTGGDYVDGHGGLHPFGIGTNPPPPAPVGAASWPTWDIARDVALLPGSADPIHAAVSISRTAGATPLPIVADASASTDDDLTPIATYRFDFGDGTVVGPQSKPTASHTYVTAGSFTMGLTATDTAGHTSTATAPAPVVVDSAPAASLLVTPAWNIAALGVTANAAASTDADATPIATYKFDFGDGTVVGPQAKPTASHTYSTAGTYTVTVTVADQAGLTGTAHRSAVVAPPAPSDIAVFAGYYDTHHPHHVKTVPSPWQGSANTVFVGQADPTTGGWDSSAVRVENTTANPMTVTVTVTIDNTTYDLWGAQVIPADLSLVLAQTAFENFDGSDTNTAGCYGCDPALCATTVSTTVPVINVTAGGISSRYFDRGQLLNTGGVDSSGCPYTGTRNDESTPWTEVLGPG